jgi:hypothetical protein
MNVYRLKNGKTSGSFQLPIRDVLIKKMVDGEPREKKIIYVEGSDSIFLEDHKGDQKGKSVWFEDGEIRVSESNWALNEILRLHHWNNKHYELVNEEETAKKEVALFETSTKVANSIIIEKDKYKLQAMAMVLISEDASGWAEFKCKQELLKYAKNERLCKVLIAEMEKPDYEIRLVAALAFNKKIIKYNSHHTAVIWNDGKEESVIIPLAQGERGIDKLSEFLGKHTEKAESVLQRIGTKTEENLKAKAAETKESNVDASPNNVSIEELRNKYKRLAGKDLSVRYINDAEWIAKKIAEIEAQ